MGVAGSATYASGTFTVNGAGAGVNNGATTDAFHFVYQPLPGDGTIVARVVSLQGSSAQAGVMIRESLSWGATNAYTFCWNAYSYLSFDAKWDFSPVAWWAGSHTIVRGHSSDPNDPIVYCDPWRDFTWTAPQNPPAEIWPHYSKF